ncbi:ras GEF [Neocallimastix californiae]|uniref:Ras GEF n=1 Tax=Neocallimastix californiae TaxID=1754190 RepID=A0A1Y2EXY7_9FUNG|nr:ras GEF [Neocallimastix californiae]|eukprot:ORY76448.1 ras GEF [Neocallimastix californiae]
MVFANDDGIIVLEKDCNYCPNDLKSRNRSLSRVSITDDGLNSLKNIHYKQDQNWISKSLRKLSIASSTPPNLSGAKLNNDKTDNNYLTEDYSLAASKAHNRSYSTTSQKEKNNLFQSIRFKIKKNQQYHSNDVLSTNSQDEISTRSGRRLSKFGIDSFTKKSDIDVFANSNKKRQSYGSSKNGDGNGTESKTYERKDLEEVSNNNKKIINSYDYKPRCFRAGMLDSSISKNFAIVGTTVTHEYLPEMDIVCGYVQLEFDNEGKVPVFAMLIDYELIFFEDDKCKNEIFRITTETCSSYPEPKIIDCRIDGKSEGKNEKSENRKSKIEKNKENESEGKEGKTDKSDHRRSKYDKNKSENSSKDKVDDKNKEKEEEEEDFSFIVSNSQCQFKLQTINNTSMIRWMATINTASSNIALALHLSSQYQQNSESIFDENDRTLDIYNKEYISLIRDFNYNNKLDINKTIIENNKKEERLPSPTIHGSPVDLISKNIPIIEVTSKDDGYYDHDSVRKKKNRLSNLEAQFKDFKISEGTSSIENLDLSNLLNNKKIDLNSPMFNMDSVSMPSLNNTKKDSSLEIDIINKRAKKESNQEKEDILGEINTFSRYSQIPRPKRLSCGTINTVNTVSSVNSYSNKFDDDIHFENNSKYGSTMSSIYCATSERLIEGIWVGEDTPELNFLDTLIYTYRHFTTADNIMEKLLLKFQEKLPNNSDTFQEEDFLLWKPIIMIRIAYYIKRWLTLSSVDFRVESVRSKLDSFVSSLSSISVFENGEPLYSYMLYKDLLSLQKMFTKYIDEVLKEIDFSKKSDDAEENQKLPEFINLDPTMVAYKLTAMESERFQNIKPIEFILNLWNTNDESPYIQHEMSHLKKMVEASNHLSYWVITEILTQPLLKPRVKVLEMFIKIAHICKKLNNYQTLFSICSGLGHSQITRLKMTWEAIQPKYKNRFNDLEKITSIARNYNTYRQIHANLSEKDKNSSHYIPFIALLIKDLYFFNDGNPKYIDESKLKSLRNEENNETTSVNEHNPTNISSPPGSNRASILGSSLKSTENDISSFLTNSTSNYSLNQDFGLESIDEVESNTSQFEKDDGGSILDDDDILDIKIIEAKSEGELPVDFGINSNIDCLTNKVLSIESTTSTVTITTTTNQMINFYKLKKIMEQIRKIEHCQRQSCNYQFNNLSTPLEEQELPRNYYHILNNDKALNKYSLLCEQREGAPVRMVSKWVEDNK